MQIGILKTGDVHPALIPRHGEYADMFSRLLNSADPDMRFFTVDVDGGAPLGEPGAADGWIVTGSKHGVYEDHAWIPPLKAFLREAVEARIPVAGICFGHQILAEAMGGKVVKSDKGWGIGVHGYQPGHVPGWLADTLPGAWQGHAVHQDQVIELPPGATVLASSDFCPFAALAYGDPERPDAISVQPHPEFEADLVGDLIDVRLEPLLPADRVAAAREQLGQPVDNAAWAKILTGFFRRKNAGDGAPALASETSE